MIVVKRERGRKKRCCAQEEVCKFPILASDAELEPISAKVEVRHERSNGRERRARDAPVRWWRDYAAETTTRIDR